MVCFKGSKVGVRSRVGAPAGRVRGWRIKTASTAYMCQLLGEKTRETASELRPNIVVQKCDVGSSAPPTSWTVGVLVPHPDGAVLHMNMTSA